MKWIQLSAERAQSLYGIPAEIANAEKNAFYGVAVNLPYEYEADRPLLALLRPPNRPDVITLHIKTIRPETWEYEGQLLNPFSVAIGGYLDLDKDGLIGLMNILSSYERQLSPKPGEDRPTFKEIEDSRLADFRLHPEWFPAMRLEHYLQTTDPLDSSVLTVVILGQGIGFRRINLDVIQFPADALHDPSFSPLDSGLSKINLNWSGTQDLVMILQNRLADIE